MNNAIASALFLGLVSVTATWVIVYWHIATKGTWRGWPAGRSLMGLLGIISVGFGFGTINRFIEIPLGKTFVGVLLYALFEAAIIFIGLTIRKEMRRGKKKIVSKSPDRTGPVAIIVASRNEETPDGE